MTLSTNKPREGEDAMIMKDSTTSRSKLSQSAPVFLTVGEEYRLASPLEDNQLPDRPTVQEVARWLRKSPNTIYLWCRQGLIPHKVVGRSKIFDKAALIEWAKPKEAA
jgi:Helix-turn-helix domain